MSEKTTPKRARKNHRPRLKPLGWAAILLFAGLLFFVSRELIGERARPYSQAAQVKAEQSQDSGDFTVRTEQLAFDQMYRYLVFSVSRQGKIAPADLSLGQAGVDPAEPALPQKAAVFFASSRQAGERVYGLIPYLQDPKNPKRSLALQDLTQTSQDPAKQIVSTLRLDRLASGKVKLPTRIFPGVHRCSVEKASVEGETFSLTLQTGQLEPGTIFKLVQEGQEPVLDSALPKGIEQTGQSAELRFLIPPGTALERWKLAAQPSAVQGRSQEPIRIELPAKSELSSWRIKPKVSLVTDQGHREIKAIYLTPISARVEVAGDFTGEPSLPMQALRKDGAVIEGLYFSNQRKDQVDLVLVWPEPIDPKQLQELQVGDLKIPLK